MALEIIGGFFPSIVECTYDPIQRHISYAFKYKSYVNKLDKGLQALMTEQERLQYLVEDEKRNGKVILRDVEEWLVEVGEIIDRENTKPVVAEEKAKLKCFFGFCPNLKARYQVSSEAKKKAGELVKLKEKRRGFSTISHTAPVQCMAALSIKDYEALESRMSVLEGIMTVLTMVDVSMIGVYGIGGVGKTTLAKEVLRQAKEQKLFDEVVIVTVTIDVNVKDIQAQIGEALGLKFDGVESVKVRASRLFGRLEKEKKVLIILDDLWKKLDLAEVGIPSKDQCSGCKILLTSRDLDVLSNAMDCQKNFEVGCLPENEAWDLFQKMANESFEQRELRSTAIEVAKVCAGLPVAIVTVAGALKNKSLPEWNNALLELKNAPSTDPTSMHATIYSTIEFSYRNLQSNELKSIFLLCSQMGYTATVGDLLKYGIGLGLFSHVSTIEEAQNRVYSLVQRLKALCLLLEGNTKNQLVMHDFVRDVGRWIAARDYGVLIVSDKNKIKEWGDDDKLKTCSRIWICSNVNEVPVEMQCPKLVFVYVDGKDRNLEVPDNLFKGAHQLKVLDFTSFSFSSLPSSLALLENLKTLCFHHSLELGDVSVVGKLKKLEVLSFAKSNIKHLPREIGKLTKLKLLNLSDCRRLETISSNVLSRLSHLEELYMGNSFDKWATEGHDTASLVELKQLISLTNLEISIQDARLISEDIFSNKLCRFKIFIGSISDWDNEFETLTILKLELNTNLHMKGEVMHLFKKTEDLYLDGLKGVKNFMLELDKDGFPKLKHLHLCNSVEIKHIIDTTTEVVLSVAFPALESLYLRNLVSLEKIYHYRVKMQYFFSKLRMIKVEQCGRLKHLFSFLVAQGLSQLREIQVNSCESLEELVAEEIEMHANRNEASDVIEFSQLESLSLTCLAKLRSFCYKAKPQRLTRRGSKLLETNVNEDVKAPLTLFDDQILFPNLKGMILVSIDNIETLWHGQLPAIKNSFQNLTELHVESCNSMKFVFSYSLIESLGQLKSLDVSNCETLEEVILVEEESGEEQWRRKSKAVSLPKLQSVWLYKLPKLDRFCKGYLVECQSLKNLSIWKCPQLKTFVSQECKEVKNNDQNAKHTEPLFDEMVIFPSLAKLKISDMDSIVKIWHNQLAPSSFCNLKYLDISLCKKLANIFPPTLLVRLQKLEMLDISTCDCVEEIFGVEGSNYNAEKISFQLKDLRLFELPKLRHTWPKDSHTAFIFPNLRTVQIELCWVLRNVFPRSIAENLFELEELTVRTCGVEEIVARGENGEAAEVNALMWLKLKKLNVLYPLSLLQKVYCNLEELTLYREDVTPSQILDDHFQFSKLKVLNLHSFLDEWDGIPFGFLQKLHNLEKLSVEYSTFKELFSCNGAVAVTGVLTCLKHLEFTSLHALRHIWEQKSNVLVSPLLQNIETLQVWWCGSLVTLAPSSASFQNLTTLVVYHCSRLLSLITVFTAKSLGQLISFKITCCDVMTEIIGREGNVADADDHGVIIFTKLQCLELVDLKSLTSFCSENHTFIFPSLKEVIVKRCPKMRVFSPGLISTPKLNEVYLEQYSKNKWRWEGNLNSTIQKIYNEMVGFDGMLHLKLSEFPELKEIWHGPLPVKPFHGLVSLVVDDCSFLSSVVPSNLLPYLGNLGELHVRNCDSLEEVFVLERPNADEGHVKLLPNLNELCLSDLPKLMNICNRNPPRVLEFKCLKRLEIHNCPNLENIFTPSVALSLEQLVEIEIRNCIMLEEIFMEEKAGEAATEQAADLVAFLPNLIDMCLTDLPRLLHICSRNPPRASVFKGLKRLKIHNCGNLQNIFTPSMALGLVKLKEIEIRDCIALEEIFMEDKAGEAATDQTADLVALLPKLKELQLSDLPRLQQICNKNSQGIWEFQRLKRLVIHNCSSLRHVLTTLMPVCFVQLHTIEIRNCQMLEEVIIREREDEAESDDATIFPLLDTLILDCLPSLINISSGNGIHLNFPSLENICIEKCPNMKPLFSSLSRGLLLKPVGEGKKARPGKGTATEKCPNMKSFISFLRRGPRLGKEQHYIQTASRSTYTAAFPRLKKLRLEWHDTVEEIMHGPVADRYFSRLEVLELINFPNDHTVLPFYFLRSFPNVQDLVLANALFEEISAHDEAIGEGQCAKLLANLRSLKLSKLPKLICLTKENTLLCSVFQHLETLEVVECGITQVLAPSSVSFQCLITLEVSECNDLLYLLTSTAAGSLVQLKRLIVGKCRTIEQIVPNEENQAGKAVTFSKLERLELHCLPRLMSFSLWNCAFIFPSLQYVFVSECSKMKIFSQGLVLTPVLKRVQRLGGIDRSCWEGSLNATIHRIFIETHMDQAVPLENQPNLDAETAQPWNSRTSGICVNEYPDAIEELSTEIGATISITTEEKSVEDKTFVWGKYNSPTSTTKTTYSQFGGNLIFNVCEKGSASVDMHLTNESDSWKDLFSETEPTKNVRVEEDAAKSSLVEPKIVLMALTHQHSHAILKDRVLVSSIENHISSLDFNFFTTLQVQEDPTMCQNSSTLIDIENNIVFQGLTEPQISDELRVVENLNGSNSLETVEEGIITCSYTKPPEMTRIASTRQVFHSNVSDKEATSDQGTQHTATSGAVIVPISASKPNHLSQDNFLNCIMTPDDNFMDPAFAQNAIELLEWKINADREDHPGVYFLAELVADLKQFHSVEEPLISLGASPSMLIDDHKGTFDKYIEELGEVKERMLQYEKALADLEKQRQKLLQSKARLFEQIKKRSKLFEAVKIDLCAARNYSIS